LIMGMQRVACPSPQSSGATITTFLSFPMDDVQKLFVVSFVFKLHGKAMKIRRSLFYAIVISLSLAMGSCNLSRGSNCDCPKFGDNSNLEQPFAILP
jgi:hypothetical protein